MHLRHLHPAEFSTWAPTLVEIYIDAMGYDPTVSPQRVRTWRRDSTEVGFHAVAAEDEYGVHGIAYGFLGGSHTWWDQQLRRGIRQRNRQPGQAVGELKPEDLELVRNYFEIAEIHVHPRCQGRGIGTLLLRELVHLAPARFALLSTPEVPDEDNGAFRLYRAHGFSDVLRNFAYPGDERRFAVLAAQLPLRPPA
ncbi:GNAT family N-acetyltransferase [Corynebacterium lizhenjunii]|uniref:GNAT family N-acetyltransferase n=1 Tax=Corynebacterium lizhenjunii TaxID=2709394 RepID=A0A7T0KEK7_9CORY|nr:N-acetyltransferase [Corynebacterium lizhenjunii]QPK78514.1 GNAT family N-acetyltransferase [Corynebacterium lizhenjunii]